MGEIELVPAMAGSPLALSLVEIGAGPLTFIEPEHDSLLYVVSGSGTVSLGDAPLELAPRSAALVLAGEEATLAGGDGLSVLRATIGPEADRHASLGPRETVVRLDPAVPQSATGARSYQVLFGPSNGSTRATLFAGYLPPGRAPWHFHLYDEIVWVPEGPGRLHLGGRVEDLGTGSAFRLQPRQVHIVENASSDREMTVVGIFTPAGSPSAAYLAESGAGQIRPVLLYDAGCRLCRFAARTVARLDRRQELALLPLSDPDAAAFLARLPEEERLSSWRLALSDGTLVGEGVGGSALLQAIGLDRSARMLAALPDPILEALYGLVARNRSRLGRLVPDGPAPRRFRGEPKP